MRVTLINHACCKVETNGLGILFDPWTEGPAFNAGWDLLIPTPMGFDEIMAGVSLIWISHKHPDHFSPAFLIRVAKAHGNRVTILFQATRDRRVADLLQIARPAFPGAQGLRAYAAQSHGRGNLRRVLFL